MAFKIYRVSFKCEACGFATHDYDRISDRPECCPICGTRSVKAFEL